MSRCPSCDAELSAGGKFCPECGRKAGGGALDETVLSAPPAGQPETVVSRGSISASGSGGRGSSRGRFEPGQILDRRYRIVALLGRGGMGEVYRADDLKLDQPVALKFLPDDLATHPDRLARFHGEVRIARQVSHRNVCRVYDIGEVDGLHYLSMEYINGEDLSQLLKRIGRLPSDKGIEIARQLCAGLSAAHDQGILHRDLKPANVMIDGEGQVRITDFGLAVLAGEAGDGTFAGTPAYMAPELLRGEDAGVRSEIYALGLVLYEIFTGRPAQSGGSVAEISRHQSENRISSMSTIISDVDPVAERVVFRCLELDPEDRPRSVLQVAAALPGGDPLAAALAAGETPSPEMVAAAGQQGAVSSLFGWLCFFGILVAMIAGAELTHRQQLIEMASLPKPKAVLADRAQQIFADLGYADPPVDRAQGFSTIGAYLDYIEQNDKSPERWDRLRTGRHPSVVYWYRESPVQLRSLETTGRVRDDDPPQLTSGMRGLQLDPEGRLIRLDAVPSQVAAPRAGAPDPDWRPLFAAADLDPSRFTPTDSLWNPPVHCDSVAAWLGSYAENPDDTLRVEAGALGGKAVYFRIHAPWSRPDRMASGAGSNVAGQVLNVTLVLMAIFGAALIVRRNLKRGLGDRRGAARLALFVLALGTADWILGADHVSIPQAELDMFVTGIGGALFLAAWLWLLYLGLEPAVRKRWPRLLTAWSRLLAGRIGDPLVGRDVLIGILAGMLTILVVRLSQFVPVWLGMRPPPISSIATSNIGDPALILSRIFAFAEQAMLNALFFLFFPLLLFIIVRRMWIAIGLLFVVLVAMFTLSAPEPIPAAISGLILSGGWLYVAIRVGLLASTVSFFSFFLLINMPASFDTSAWYFGSLLPPTIVVLALAIFSLRSALGGHGRA